MKTKLLIPILSILSISSVAQVVPNIDWVKYYSEKATISNVPSAIDAGSNVYITGYTYPTPSNADLTTIKYDALGNLIWVRNYNNGGFDDANAITLDASGNIYVTGESDGTGTGRDLITIKYDASGTQLWAVRYNGAFNGNDVANAIFIDPAGNVYVTGKTTVTGVTTNYVTVKYNASGVQQWVHTYNGTGNNNDESVAIDYSSTGRLFITGTSQNVSANSDIVTIRINPNTGSQMWVKSINGTANSNDIAFSILSDGNDVVVVGSQKNTTTNDDYVTLKYNGNTGTTLWQKTYDSGNNINVATSITKDASNNFAVTGTTLNGSLLEYHTLMYNNSGVQQWVNINPTNIMYSSVTPKVATDPIANHFYVCGEKKIANNDILVYQITPGGNKTWEKTFNGAMNNQDAAVDLVVNSSGILYVAGASLNSTAKFDYTTIRISQTPVYFPIEAVTENPSNSIQYFENKGLVLTTSGTLASNIKYFTQGNKTADYIATNSISHVFSEIDTIAVSKDSLEKIDLSFVGSNTLTSVFDFEPNADTVNFYLPQTGNSGVSLKGAKRLLVPNIYPDIDLHYYTNTAGLKYYFVVKPNAKADVIRINVSNNATISLNGSGDLKINNILGNITYLKPTAYQINLLGMIVPVSFTPSYNVLGNDFMFTLATYNHSLPLIIVMKQATPVASPTAIKNMNWSTYYGGSSDDVFLDVCTNSSNNVWVTGYTNSINFPILNSYQGTNAGNTDAIFVKFNNLGVRQWATYFGGSLTETDLHIHGIEVDGNGNSYSAFNTLSTDMPLNNSGISGAYFDNSNTTIFGCLSPGDIAIVSFNNSGALIWSTYFGGNGCTAKTYDIGLDGNNNLFVTGIDNGFPLINPPLSYSNTFPISSGGAYFIAKFNPSHNLVWSTFFGENGPMIEKIAFTSNNDIVIVGNVNNQTGANFEDKNPGGGAYYDNTFNGGAYDGFIAKFDGTTNGLIWSSYFGGNDDERLHGLTIDNSNNIYISGESQSNSGLITGNTFGISNTTNSGMGTYFSGPIGDGVLAKFNSTNQFVSSTYFGGAANDGSFGLTFKNNNLFAPFVTAGTDLPFCGSNPSAAFVQSNNIDGQDVSNDSYFTAMDNNFNFKWSTYFGGTNLSSSTYLKDDKIFSNIATNDNKYYIVGGTTSNLNFPLSNPLGGAYYSGTKSSSVDAFIAQFDVSILPVGIKESSKDNENLLIYPNPANNFLYIKYNSTLKYSIEIIDITGRIVYFSENHNNTIEKINIEYLAKGSYVIKVTNKENTSVKKLILN